MIERVARALCIANEATVAGTKIGPDQVFSTGPLRGLPYWMRYIDMARAAMTAMKYVDGTDEPNLITVSNEEHVEAVSLIMAWDGLIDAALADG